ncbi:piggyBac transposable element-derived protein 3-like [Schistocerca nitens]|uniref:piggyBac transposable element-derived protein 3-like n=1 Tax=Schistocerca nitens TaxID=7011 RepID=UPI0021178789|nr:piggyBac transposable element-derived protein 3-like [Schistocerca nitens]
MARDRYYKLQNKLHIVNNFEEHGGNDKLWKVRPVIVAFRNKCISLLRSQHLSVDEQMIPFTGRCNMRTYVPNKPNPLGLKNFILASSDGLVLDFAVYNGKETIPESDQNEHELGVSILKLLARTVPIDYSHVIYSDRFFTSSKSVQLLLDRNIFQTGTLMANRIKEVASKFKRHQELQWVQWDENIGEDQEVCALKWKGNKPVTLLSTCIGSEPEGTCKRRCNTEKADVSVKQPAIFKSYNRNMGGIDLCDRYMTYYRSNIRTKKWTVIVFNHLNDLAIINSWIMYKRIPEQKWMSLINFRIHLAHDLVKSSRIVDSLEMSKQISQSVTQECVSSSDEDEEHQTIQNEEELCQSQLEKANVTGLATYLNILRVFLPQSRSHLMCEKCNVYLYVLFC